MFPVNGSQEERLNALWRAYGDACAPPEPSANFMPQLWQKIESRQTFSFFFGRVARGFVTAAIAATLAMSFYLALPPHTPFYATTYVDVLAASHNADNQDLYETLGYESANPGEL